MFTFGRYGIGVPSIGHVSDGCKFMLGGVARIVRNNQVCCGGFPIYIKCECVVGIFYGDI
jgi:hypothetical protein